MTLVSRGLNSKLNLRIKKKKLAGDALGSKLFEVLFAVHLIIG